MLSHPLAQRRILGSRWAPRMALLSRPTSPSLSISLPPPSLYTSFSPFLSLPLPLSLSLSLHRLKWKARDHQRVRSGAVSLGVMQAQPIPGPVLSTGTHPAVPPYPSSCPIRTACAASLLSVLLYPSSLPGPSFRWSPHHRRSHSHSRTLSPRHPLTPSLPSLPLPLTPSPYHSRRLFDRCDGPPLLPLSSPRLLLLLPPHAANPCHWNGPLRCLSGRIGARSSIHPFQRPGQDCIFVLGPICFPLKILPGSPRTRRAATITLYKSPSFPQARASSDWLFLSFQPFCLSTSVSSSAVLLSVSAPYLELTTHVPSQNWTIPQLSYRVRISRTPT